MRAFLPGLGLLLAIAAQAQDSPKLTARELFYTPVAEAKPAATKSHAAKPVAKRTKQSPVRPAEPESSPDESSLKNASTMTEAAVGPPLALKYRLLKRSADGRYDEVDTDTVFRSGDKIRVSVEANDDGYLYIVQQGSSKTWNLLFPNEDTDHGSNRVQRNREYDLPGGGRFAFDEQPGEERLFIVLSRRPEPDLEKLIYSLNGDTKPASTDKTGDTSKLMLAQSSIRDEVIDRLRGAIARDLVFEKVNDDAPAAKPAGFRKEKALYVASQDRTADAQVVVDLSLNHQ